MSKFIQEDVEFLHSLNNTGRQESNIYTTAQHGYVRNLDRDKLQRLESIYKRSINAAFVLCFHCSAEIMRMVKDLYGELEKEQPAHVTIDGAPVWTSAPAPAPKRKATKTPLIIGEGDE